jgi:serine phosphatase RsbU (regulator of sigma subunit)
MKINATSYMTVEIDPVTVLKDVVINRDNWIIEKDGKFLVMSSDGPHEIVLTETNRETFDAWNASKLLIQYLERGKRTGEKTGIV